MVLGISVMVKIRRQKVRPHKKKRDPAPRPRTRRGFSTFVKFAFWTIIVALIGAGVVGFQYMFADSDLFNVKGLDVRFYDEQNVLRRAGFSGIDDKSVLGENIFLVDLNDFKEKIESSHPEFKDVMVRRALPNRLIVQVKKRLPAAQIYGDRLYFIDIDGIFLPDVKSADSGRVPLISGIRASPYRAGSIQKDKIRKALSLIKALSENIRLSRFKIKTIDIADSRNVSFFLDAADAEKMEIKIGEGEFAKRLDVLATVLEQLARDVERVKYIDLRFDDPIVGPK
ncbi:MAG: cell division protein FtsQ/DivIB [Candidatus Omnitrophota bacterium]|nr:cell division protein FtsQ/DivIB [Candidatus Omnitrophota bacterium]